MFFQLGGDHAHELGSVRDTHFIGPEVNDGADIRRDFLAELIQQLRHNLHALRGVHLETESAVEIGAVAGHIQLRDDGDAALFCVSKHLADFIVGIGVLLVASAVLGRVQLRIGFALDMPGGVIRKVPVEEVDFETCREVELFLQTLHLAEIAAAVLHVAAVFECRPVHDEAVGNGLVLVYQLAQCLQAVEEPGSGFSPDGDSFVIHLEHIALGFLFIVQLISGIAQAHGELALALAFYFAEQAFPGELHGIVLCCFSCEFPAIGGG